MRPANITRLISDTRLAGWTAKVTQGVRSIVVPMALGMLASGAMGLPPSAGGEHAAELERAAGIEDAEGRAVEAGVHRQVVVGREEA